MTQTSMTERKGFFDLAPVKLFVLGGLVLILLLPLGAILGLVRERAARRAGAQQEVARTWGGEQALLGPLLVLRSTYLEPQAAENGKPLPPVAVHRVQYVLPESLHWTVRLEPEIRRRGLFEVILYEAHLRAEGELAIPERLGPAEREFRWGTADLVVGIPDVKGLQKEVVLRWGGRDVAFLPGTAGVPELDAGLEAPVAIAPAAAPGTRLPFGFEIVLHGSETMNFLPTGRQTTVEVASPWRSPSFEGAFLPQQHNISPSGFTAQWSIYYLSRNLPQTWEPGDINAAQLRSSLFGVRLLLPADDYQKSERSLKYGVLFILLTFVTFFLLELLSPVRLFAMQYLLVGFALCLFYLLLLALSEQIGFPRAYLVAATASALLVATYARSILASGRWAGLLLACLAGLYGYLFVLLQAEDYALLMGALGLFVILAAVMFITRRLDWRELRFRPSVAP